MNRVAVIGAGAWGTALALVARRAGRRVLLWAHEAAVVDAVNRDHENPVFLPGIALDPAIRATADPAEALAGAEAVLLVVPAQFVRPVATRFAPLWPPGLPAVVCAKGIEQGTNALMSEVLAEALPAAALAVLSGPTFAAEVARDLPTAVTLACTDHGLADRLLDAIGTPRFRTYLSPDVIGAQLGGAVKNVLAIGCGIVEGRGFGDNARAALITRGLAEIGTLSHAMGARRDTLMGLSGLGDLTLTCNALQSRNFSLGVALGRGESLAAVLGARKAVTEGVFTASSVAALAAAKGVDMPICTAVDAILNHGAAVAETVQGLLARPFREESPYR